MDATEILSFLLDGAYEYAVECHKQDGSDEPTEPTVTEGLRDVWYAFSHALDVEIPVWVNANPQHIPEGMDACDFACAIACREDRDYAIYMTLDGAGVGIWDGRWDDLMSEDAIESLSRHIKRHLSGWCDGTGCGRIPEAMQAAMFPCD